MNHCIIRTCPKDDFISRLCYESFKRFDFIDKYYFLCEDGKYWHIKDLEAILIYRKEVANFGGQSGARVLFDCLKQIDFNDKDNVFIVDSDVVLFENPMQYLTDYEHAGVGGIVDGMVHVSGQVQIVKGYLASKFKYLSYDDISLIVEEMIVNNKSVNDDTVISYITDKMKCKKVLLNEHNLWVHYKFYDMVKEFDYLSAIKKIQNTRL
jgi:hypothetical protein